MTPGTDPDVALSQRDAAKLIDTLTSPVGGGEQAPIVAANPAFDAAMLAALMDRFDLKPAWSYHLIDIEAMALGYLHVQARWLNARAEGDNDQVTRAEELRELATPPYRSDDLSRACGVWLSHLARGNGTPRSAIAGE